MALLSLDLLDLVLQRLNRHPIGALNGVDMDTFGSEALKFLLERQILVQQPMLEELDGWPVQWIGTKPFLFDLDADRAPEEVDLRLLTLYEINVLALCRALRRANQLAGPPVAELAEGAYFIGHRGSGKRRRSLCLVRLLRDDRALEMIHLLRGHIATGQLVVLTPNVVQLHRLTLRSLATEGALVVSVPDALVTSASAAPFTLDIPMQLDADAGLAASARLRLDTGNRIATLDGGEVALTPREFDVLVALANEAKEGVGFVPRGDLLTIIEAHRRDDDRTAGPRDLENAISRTRRALAKAAGLPSSEGIQIIQSRRGEGYRLRSTALGLEQNEIAIF
jgi:DNA-binding winged helix-turn-helix (wHTH) protein